MAREVLRDGVCGHGGRLIRARLPPRLLQVACGLARAAEADAADGHAFGCGLGGTDKFDDTQVKSSYDPADAHRLSLRVGNELQARRSSHHVSGRRSFLSSLDSTLTYFSSANRLASRHSSLLARIQHNCPISCTHITSHRPSISV